MSLEISRQEKLKELEVQQAKLKELQTELEHLNSKIKNHEKLSAEDTKLLAILAGSLHCLCQ